MGAVLGATVDLLHALLMAAWVLGLPLLFWHRWPRVTEIYAWFAVAFVILNRLSDAFLGECFLTAIARACWRSVPGAAGSATTEEWFTVRFAEAIFRMTPSHRAIKLVSEALVLVTGAGVAFRSAVPGRGRFRRGGRQRLPVS